MPKEVDPSPRPSPATAQAFRGRLHGDWGVPVDVVRVLRAVRVAVRRAAEGLHPDVRELVLGQSIWSLDRVGHGQRGAGGGARWSIIRIWSRGACPGAAPQ